jgi:hypothetical protein
VNLVHYARGKGGGGGGGGGTFRGIGCSSFHVYINGEDLFYCLIIFYSI